MKLSEWARSQYVHPKTAYRWFREGKLPVAAHKLPSGTIMVEASAAPAASTGVVLYARVSSADQRADLERQLGRLVSYAVSAGMPVGATVSEIGSGLNGHRAKLLRLLADPKAAVIVVEHRDRSPHELLRPPLRPAFRPPASRASDRGPWLGADRMNDSPPSSKRCSACGQVRELLGLPGYLSAFPTPTLPPGVLPGSEIWAPDPSMLHVSGHIEIVGSASRLLSKGQVIDAALSSPQFASWLGEEPSSTWSIINVVLQDDGPTAYMPAGPSWLIEVFRERGVPRSLAMAFIDPYTGALQMNTCESPCSR
jgi:hypothetical protein